MKSEKRRQARAGVLSSVFAVLTLSFYMSVYRQEYGVLTMSKVSTLNRWLIARQYGLINPNVIKDSAFQLDIRESYRLHGETMVEPYCEEMIAEERYIWSKYSIKTINEALNASFFSHPLKNLSTIVNRAKKASSKRLFFFYAKFGGLVSLSNWIPLRIKHLYIFLAVYAAFILAYVIRKGYIPWLSMSLYLLSIGNLFVVLIGAPEEWNRLMMPSFPFLIILFAQLCTLFRVKPFSQLEFG